MRAPETRSTISGIIRRRSRLIGTSIGVIAPILLFLSSLHLRAPIVDSPIARSQSRQPATATPQRNDRSRDETIPDSVTVLLFAGTMPASLTIEGKELMVDGRSLSGEKLCLHAKGSRVVAEGRRTDDCMRIRSSSMVTLTAEKRSRRVEGPIAIAAADGRLVVTVRMALRRYLTATLAAEASANDPSAYLTALAVVQRNYMVSHIGRHAPLADLCDNTHCQVTNLGPRPHAFTEAVERSLEITLDAGGALPCYYCGACGGGTLLPGQIWRRPEPGYANVSCSNCRESRWFRWSRTVPATAGATQLLGEAPARPFIDDDFKIRVGRAIGFNAMPSNTVDRIERHDGSYLIEGRGFGHRIGLCQEGAKVLARRGRNAAEILRFYFPTATIVERTDPTTEMTYRAR